MKVVLIAVVSLNGKISRNDSSIIDWSSKSDLEWFKEITKKIGVVVVGRKTFETFKSPLQNRLNVVMTHNPVRSNRTNLIYTSDSPLQITKTVEKMGYDHLAIIGGREIFTLFIKEKLVDELYITYEPIVIDGMDLFNDIGQDVKLKLIEIKILDSQSFVVHYENHRTQSKEEN